MTFEAELRRELARCGIDGRRGRRIVAELHDHLACDPDARLGSPKLIAERFAEELRLVETRRATYAAFAALVVTAVFLLAAIAAGGSTPSGLRGVVAALAGLEVIITCQVAFVGGVLGLWLLVRGGTELRLVQRRMLVGLAAAALALTGLAAQVALQGAHEAGGRFVLGAAAAGAPAVGLVFAAVALRRASTLTPREPPSTPGLPPWFVVGAAALVCSAMTIGSGFAENSAAEGLLRGAFELSAFVAGFFALGRFLGLRPPLRHETVPTLRQ